MQNEMEWRERFEKLEGMIEELIRRQAVKDWYSTEELARILGRAEFTVREWCRNRRIHCQKKANGRGKHHSWAISHEEVLRIQREGLLPLERTVSIPRDIN